MKTIFWCINAQEDFFDGGIFKVYDSESIRPKIKQLTELAKNKKIKVVSVASWNDPKSKWFSEVPDLVKTFPPHCLAKTKGTSFITEAIPDSEVFLVENDVPYIVFPELHKKRNIVILKNEISLIEGNKFSDTILNNLGTAIMERPKYIVYGVGASLIAKDLTRRGYEVKVVSDASLEFPGTEINYEEFNINKISTEELLNLEIE